MRRKNKTVYDLYTDDMILYIYINKQKCPETSKQVYQGCRIKN